MDLGGNDKVKNTWDNNTELLKRLLLYTHTHTHTHTHCVYVYVCVCVFSYMNLWPNMCQMPAEGKKDVGSPGTEIIRHFWATVWMLGTKLGSSKGKSINTSNSRGQPEWVPGQPGLYRETLSWKNKQKPQKQQQQIPQTLSHLSSPMSSYIFSHVLSLLWMLETLIFIFM